MRIIATYVNLYHVCKRELWLHANGIRFEHTSDLVYEGRLVHETAYPQRSERYEELEMDGCKIDYYDAKNKIIHEIKKSNKVEKAHEWQLKYYILIFERNGVEGVVGILEYPELRKKDTVSLTPEDREYLLDVEKDIVEIISGDQCPDVISGRICKQCSYEDFCYSQELEV